MVLLLLMISSSWADDNHDRCQRKRMINHVPTCADAFIPDTKIIKKHHGGK
jgi:hypothetical protein